MLDYKLLLYATFKSVNNNTIVIYSIRQSTMKIRQEFVASIEQKFVWFSELSRVPVMVVQELPLLQLQHQNQPRPLLLQAFSILRHHQVGQHQRRSSG